jgi:hypothetical protein
MPVSCTLRSTILAVLATLFLAGDSVLAPTVARAQASSRAGRLEPNRGGQSTSPGGVPARGQKGMTSHALKAPKSRRYRIAEVSSWESVFWAEAMGQQGNARKPAPSGLVAVIKNDPTQPLDPKPFRNPYISGVAIQIHWSDIEPARGEPNWARLDALFAAAQTSHKWVHLLIFPGFFSPAWALQGAEQDQFKVQYGPDAGHTMWLPMPYDPVYLGNWFAFVKLVGERYGDHPAFLMIGAAGPTSATDEFTEPDTYPTDITKWMYHHFTSTKYFEAWQQAFETYARTFPNQYISLSHGNGVDIDAEGAYDPEQPSRTRTEVVGEALSTLGGRFVFQSSALRGNAHREEAIQMVISYNGLCATGFQLSTSCEHSPTAMGAAGNPPLALRLSIENGMQVNPLTGKHADYIEIYSDDVEAADLQPVLRWGASLFGP